MSNKKRGIISVVLSCSVLLSATPVALANNIEDTDVDSNLIEYIKSETDNQSEIDTLPMEDDLDALPVGEDLDALPTEDSFGSFMEDDFFAEVMLMQLFEEAEEYWVEEGSLAQNSMDYDYDQDKKTYTIHTARGLAYISNLVNGLTYENGFVETTTPESLQGSKVILSTDINLEDRSWNPIGYYANNLSNTPFKGEFDGKGFIVQGLETNEEKYYQGLFGYAEGASLSNVTLEGSVKGAYYTGALVGCIAPGSSQSVISNVYNYASVEAKSYAGGVVGAYRSISLSSDEQVVIRNISNNGSVTASDGNAGGVIGSLIQEPSNSSTIVIMNAYNNADISGSSISGYAGGILGYTKVGTNANLDVMVGYSDGQIQAKEAGDIAGYLTTAGGTATVREFYASEDSTVELISSGNVTPSKCYTYDSDRVVIIADKETALVDALNNDIRTEIRNIFDDDSSTITSKDLTKIFNVWDSVDGKNDNLPIFDNKKLEVFDTWKEAGEDAVSGVDYLVDSEVEVYTPKGLAYVANDVNDYVDNAVKDYDGITVEIKNSLDFENKYYIFKDPNWIPIADKNAVFKGTIKGEKDTVLSNLSIKNDEKANAALIGRADNAKFENIAFGGINVISAGTNSALLVAESKESTYKGISIVGSITGDSYVGGLVASSKSDTIIESSVDATVLGEDYIGGFVGYSDSSTIKNSSHIGSVTGDNAVGGFIGSMKASNIYNCYSLSKLSSENIPSSISGAYSVGGIAGELTDKSNVKNVYNTVKVTGDVATTGTVIGKSSEDSVVDRVYAKKDEYDLSGEGTLTNSYAFENDKKIPDNDDDIVVDRTLVETLNKNVVLHLGEGYFRWAMVDGSDYPVFSNVPFSVYATWKEAGEAAVLENDYDVVNGELTIKTPKGLAWFADKVNTVANSYTKVNLSNDIDFYSRDYIVKNANWIPIGNSTNKAQNFEFDGKGSVIKHIEAVYSENTDVMIGLFGYTSGVTIKNLGISRSKFTGENNVGTFVGYAHNSFLNNIYSTMTDVKAAARAAGGIVGQSANSAIVNAYAKNTVSAGQNWSGEIVGFFDGYKNILYRDEQSDVALADIYYEQDKNPHGGYKNIDEEEHLLGIYEFDEDQNLLDTNGKTLLKAIDAVANYDYIPHQFLYSWKQVEKVNGLYPVFGDLHPRAIILATDNTVNLSFDNKNDKAQKTDTININTINGSKYVDEFVIDDFKISSSDKEIKTINGVEVVEIGNAEESESTTLKIGVTIENVTLRKAYLWFNGKLVGIVNFDMYVQNDNRFNLDFNSDIQNVDAGDDISYKITLTQTAGVDDFNLADIKVNFDTTAFVLKEIKPAKGTDIQVSELPNGILRFYRDDIDNPLPIGVREVDVATVVFTAKTLIGHDSYQANNFALSSTDKVITTTGNYRFGVTPDTTDNIGKVWDIQVTFDENGGVLEGEKTAQLKYGTTFGELPVPTYEGYSFLGWFDAISGGNMITSTTEVPETDITLYAQWGINTHVLTFDPSGGVVGSISTRLVSYDASILANLPTGIECPTRSGYRLIDWVDADGVTILDQTMPNENVTVYAKWEAMDYDFTYESNKLNSELIDTTVTLNKVDGFTVAEKVTADVNVVFNVNIDTNYSIVALSYTVLDDGVESEKVYLAMDDNGDYTIPGTDVRGDIKVYIDYAINSEFYFATVDDVINEGEKLFKPYSTYTREKSVVLIKSDFGKLAMNNPENVIYKFPNPVTVHGTEYGYIMLLDLTASGKLASDKVGVDQWLASQLNTGLQENMIIEYNNDTNGNNNFDLQDIQVTYDITSKTQFKWNPFEYYLLRADIADSEGEDIMDCSVDSYDVQKYLTEWNK